jgi:hypothetical protein
MKRMFFLSTLVAVLWAHLASAQIPQTMSYQGVLTNADGKPMPNGNQAITFKLYNSPDGTTPLWAETQSVAVTEGIFNVQLGSVVPFSLPFDQPYWLGMAIGEGQELSPRIELTASAYSFYAKSIADSAVTSGKIARAQVVKSINALKDDVKLVAGDNVTITTKGDTIKIAAAAGVDRGLAAMSIGA